MKLGIEVEGRLRGVPTLFCNADFDTQELLANLRKHPVSHVYISDNTNKLGYHGIGALLRGYMVTLDVTEVRAESRPANVSLMLRLDGDGSLLQLFEQVSRLTKEDQIKFERDRNVIVLPMTAAIFTQPSEFAGDVEL